MVVRYSFTPLHGERHGVLCCDYVVVGVGILPILAGSDAQFYVGHWAWGTLANGESEVLGAWLDVASDSTAWERIFEDCAERGLESIRFLLASEVRSPPSAYSSCASVRELDTVSRTLSPRLRRTVLSSEETFWRLHNDLRRSIARRGRFADPVQARSFLFRSLDRAGRRLARRLLVPDSPRPPTCAIGQTRDLVASI